MRYVYQPFSSVGNVSNGTSITIMPAVNGTLPLSFNDAERVRAVEMYETKGPIAGSSAYIQGLALLVSSIALQILARVARVSVVDIVLFRSTYVHVSAGILRLGVRGTARLIANVRNRPADSLKYWHHLLWFSSSSSLRLRSVSARRTLR